VASRLSSVFQNFFYLFLMIKNPLFLGRVRLAGFGANTKKFSAKKINNSCDAAAGKLISRSSAMSVARICLSSVVIQALFYFFDPSLHSLSSNFCCCEFSARIESSKLLSNGIQAVFQFFRQAQIYSPDAFSVFFQCGPSFPPYYNA